MKRNFLMLIFVVAIAAVSGWNFSQNRNEVALSDIALANVEALADNESSCCIGSKFKITSITGGWRCENDKGLVVLYVNFIAG